MSPNKEGSAPIDIEKIGDVDKLIHEPSRLKILAILYPLEEADFTFLKRETGYTWGRLSSHLEKLEKAGYIIMEKRLIQRDKRRKDAKEIAKTFIRIADLGKEKFEEYTISMRELFSA